MIPLLIYDLHYIPWEFICQVVAKLCVDINDGQKKHRESVVIQHFLYSAI